MADWISVVLLGLIEGITEFLPVSSTGHLLLAEHWLGHRSELFNVVIQTGAVLAVLAVFAGRAKDLVLGWSRPENRDYLLKLAAAFVITAIGGLALKKAGLKLPKDPAPIAWATLIGGVAFVGAERWLRGRRTMVDVSWTIALAIGAAYFAVWWALAVGSVSGVWPFPKLWPTLWTPDAWSQVLDSATTVWTTLGLATASASVCLVWAVAWLEVAPRRWQQTLRPWWLLPLVLPSVLWVVGLYSMALQWRLEGQWLGLLLAHAVMVLPYVLLALEPAYLAVDPRQLSVAASLGHGRWTALLRIKWPLLKRAIASAWAVGFAVSVAQYLPTLYVGAGRFATVTTEAVTLASGAQRSLMSTYAALQMLLPVLAFALAGWLGRPRQFEKIGATKENR